MVIFGGLEFVAAGYLLHEHAKHKEERARLEEEEEALERRRRRRHSADRRRRHSDERKHSHSYEYEDAKPSRPPPRPSPRPQYLSPNQYPAAAAAGASPYLAPTTAQPPRANSAPPPQHQQDPYYPPTGWPAHWPQSQRPEPNVAGPSSRPEAGPLPPKYGWRPDQDHVDTNNYPSSPRPAPAHSSRRRRSRGRSETRPEHSPAQGGSGRMAYSQQPAGSPHVRFSLPDDRAEPPPAYSR